MPTVPTYESGGVGLRRLPSGGGAPRATGASFGGALSSVSQLAQGAQQLAAGELRRQIAEANEARRRADVAVTRDAYNETLHEMRQFTSGENGIYRQEGKDAIGAYERSREYFNKLRDKKAQSLGSSRQRDMFLSSFDSAMNSHLNRIASYERQTVEKFNRDTLIASNKNLAEDMVEARYDEKALAENEADIISNIREINRGRGEEVVNAEIENQLHAVYTNMYEAERAVSPENAQAFLEKNKAKFKDKAYEAFKADTDKAVRANVIDAKAAEIHSFNLPWEEKEKLIAKAPEDMREEITKELIAKERTKNYIDSKRLADAERPIWGEVRRQGLNFSNYNGLNPTVRDKVKRYQRQLALEQSEGFTPDLSVVYGLRQRLLSKDFANIKLEEYVEKTGSSYFQELQDMQNKLIDDKNAARKDSRLYNITSASKQAMNRVRGISDFKASDEEGGKRLNAFLSAYEEDINKLTPQDNTFENRRAIIDKLLRTVDPWGFAGKKYEFEIRELTGEELQKYRSADRPEILERYDEQENASVRYDNKGQYPWVVRIEDEVPTVIFYDANGVEKKRLEDRRRVEGRVR